MTFSQSIDAFVSKWLGKKADWDGAYAGQCVDLFRYYCHEVLKISQPAGVWGAANFWTDFASDPILVANFDRIPNTAKFIPIKGDVPIWDFDAGGGFGHVSIKIDDTPATLKGFLSFDQNWPTLSKCTKTWHDYTNVYGVLRPKKSDIVVPEPIMPTDLQIYLGVQNDTEAKDRLRVLLGEYNGKCDNGFDGPGRGGDLGAARRRVKELENSITPPATNDPNPDPSRLVLATASVSTDKNTVVTGKMFNYKPKGS